MDTVTIKSLFSFRTEAEASAFYKDFKVPEGASGAAESPQKNDVGIWGVCTSITRPKTQTETAAA